MCLHIKFYHSLAHCVALCVRAPPSVWFVCAHFSLFFLCFVYCFRFGCRCVHQFYWYVDVLLHFNFSRSIAGRTSCLSLFFFFVRIFFLVQCCNSVLISSSLSLNLWISGMRVRESHRSSDFRSLRNNWIRLSHRLMCERAVISIWNVRHQPNFHGCHFNQIDMCVTFGMLFIRCACKLPIHINLSPRLKFHSV